MNISLLVIYMVMLIPLFSALFYFSNFIEQASKAGSIITVILSIAILTLSQGTYSFFDINQVNRILIISVSSVYSLAIFFASKYHSNLERVEHLKLHFSLMDVFAFTMLFTLLINNFGLMWIGIEGTTASSALLLIIERQKNQIEAAWRYVLIVSTGLSIAIISIILVYLYYNTLDASLIISKHHPNSLLLSVAGIAALIGIGTKVGIFPMHTWLPDAHGEAPSEISAMFSGILLPVAAYVLYEFYEATYTPIVTESFFIFIFLTLLFVALIMASQRNIKRMFAYSTMENMAMITLGLILGTYGLIGALLIILAHAFGKSSAFFSSGNILGTYGTKDINAIRGVRNRLPSTALSLIGSSLIVTGAPPFGVFIGEFFIIYQLFIGKNYGLAASIIVFLFIISVSVMNKVSKMVFDGNDQSHERVDLNVTQKATALIAFALSFLVTFIFLGGFL